MARVILCLFGWHAWLVAGTCDDWMSPFHDRWCAWCNRRQTIESATGRVVA